jgi:hypothetical protein
MAIQKPNSFSSLSESDIQIQVSSWLKLNEAKHNFIHFACPNEGMGEAKTGAGLGRMARLKRMGLRSGVADIVIVKAGRAYFLEMKRPGEGQSEKQILFEDDAWRAGAPYEVAHSFEEAQKIIRDWRII